jgi:hypothetical protein
MLLIYATHYAAWFVPRLCRFIDHPQEVRQRRATEG